MEPLKIETELTEEQIEQLIKTDHLIINGQSYVSKQHCADLLERYTKEKDDEIIRLKKFIKYDQLLEFDDNDWNHFYDVVLMGYGTKLTREELIEEFYKLPYKLKIDALEWGMNDTVWRENVYQELITRE